METIRQLGKCLDCDALFERCPECGSDNLGLHVWTHVNERVAIGDSARVKVKRREYNARRNPRHVVEEGWKEQADGSMAYLVRYIDKDTDRNLELVTTRNGNVLRACVEPLREHRDRGDARRRINSAADRPPTGSSAAGPEPRSPAFTGGDSEQGVRDELLECLTRLYEGLPVPPES